MELYYIMHRTDYNNDCKVLVCNDDIGNNIKLIIEKDGYCDIGEDNGVLTKIVIYNKDVYVNSSKYGFYRYLYDIMTPYVRDLKIDDVI